MDIHNDGLAINYNSGDILGNYLLEERLGGGEHSSTFRGLHRVTNEAVAVKVFPKTSPTSKDLYAAEIKAYKALRGQPGILQLIDEGENDDVFFIITEFIKEGSLRLILSKYSIGMEFKDVINLFTPVAEAVDLIHEKHIIHRDLKPENILVRNTGERYKIFIADFGVARLTTTSQQFQTEHTAGTLRYIAPEALYADPNILQTKAVDIYAFGIMLYEALEGKFPHEDIGQLLSNQPPLHPAHTHQTAGLAAVECLLKTIHNDVKQRPDSAKEAIIAIVNATNVNFGERNLGEQKWIGRKINNYRIEEVLREGTMGITMRASNFQTKKLVVLKAFTRSTDRNKQAYEKEINSFKRLDNGHGVLTPQDIFDHEGISFIVTEYQSGGTLRELMNRKAKLSITEIMEIFRQIAEAIDYIHDKKIIHRDIKPENIVYSIHEGKITPYITDFGVSAILASTQSSFSTREIGTHRYMAPELWDPKAHGTKAVDIYAFGIMLYEALVGHVPSESDTGKRHLILAAERTFKELGPHAKNILLQARAKDAVERPRTATEIMQQIRGKHEMFLGKKYGKYTIEKFIGRGTFGATYRALMDRGKKKFAFKVLAIQEPLMHEIEKLKKLGHHDGIAGILDGKSENGIHYVVTDYYNGTSLRDMLQSYQQDANLDDTLKLFKPIAVAIDYLHDVGIVHGDVKPENIILCKSKNDEDTFDPVITGFGISKIAGKIQPFLSSNNYNYIAPELWREGEPTNASDIYAFGVMLYETLEGSPPFNSKNLADSMDHHLRRKPPIPQNLTQNRGQNAANALLQCLNKNPQQRPNSALALISQIEDKTQDNTSTMIGRINGQLRRSLRPFFNLLNKRIEISLSRLTVLTSGLIIIVASVVSLLFGQVPAAAGKRSQVGIMQPTSANSDNIDSPDFEEGNTNGTGATAVPILTEEPVLIPTTSPPECNPQYPPDPNNSSKDYKANKYITLEDLYLEYYGKKRDNLDLYALAYYNNRKAVETGLYNLIDPAKLGVENGWTVFLPPRAWIDKYRAFPIPVLDRTDLDNAYSTINISGTSVLYPLSEQIVGCFEVAQPAYDIQIEPSNTIAGMADFCQGSADIFSASEDITPTVLQASSCPDVEFLKFAAAKYTAVVFVSDDNPHAQELRSLDNTDLEKLLFTAQSWNDIRSHWEAVPIIRYYPPLNGGVFEIVTSKITSDPNKPIENLNEIEETRSIAQEVAGNEFSVGFSSFADYLGQKGDLVAIPVDSVLPNLETIKGDVPTYPLTRSLYLYTGKTTFDENPLLRYFINYYLAYATDFVDDLGFFPTNVQELSSRYYFPVP
jgi:serine/threonine protein kinase/ABC-type phosphate transport system substrate-binding protein